ncbi:MAG: sodium:glutamate symporter [Fusobacteriaceae bacterium]|jgi:ESS family glutamate:Na+ symporter|nr:sodium:glutamate symporter [Fusobacteriaceae bacterium]
MQQLTGAAIWAVFVDFSIMAVLLVIGQILRAKIKLFQKILIPSALIGGFIALAFGPKGLGYIPLSGTFGTYASILIVIVFAATPIGDRPNKEALSGTVIGGMFFNITGIAVLQYAVGLIVTIYGLSYLYPNLPHEFGLMMATGFYGGHGTAAAVGKALQDLGVENMTDLGNTCATIGIVGGIIFGIVIINWGTRKGYTHYVDNPEELPIELRTGLIPPEKQKAEGKITISSICLDPMAFHLGIVLLASILGYYGSKYFLTFTKNLGYGIAIPDFCTALLFGFVVNWVLNKTNGHKYVDRHSVARIQGTATDFLMVSGIGSLNLKVVLDYAVPLLAVCVMGFLVTWWWFIYVGGKSSREDWFERNMMVWGHATGVAATGVLLQRVVDPDLKSRGIEDSGISDLFNRPIIIGLQVVPPIIMNLFPGKGGHITTWVIVAVVVVLWIFAYALKWWVPSQKIKTYGKVGNN